MADNILYNFGANASSLSDINGLMNDFNEVKSDIGSIFQTLLTVYEGQGADALNTAHTQLDGKLEEAIQTTLNTQKQAQDQQDAMQSLDRQNAASF